MKLFFRIGEGRVMTTSRYYRVTNSMLFSIRISNGIGVAVVYFLTQRSTSALSLAILRRVEDINHMAAPLKFVKRFYPAWINSKKALKGIGTVGGHDGAHEKQRI
jgi:hypothetical protein